MAPVDIRKLSNIYRKVVSRSIPSGGKIIKTSKNQYSITCQHTATDCDNLESVKTINIYQVIVENRRIRTAIQVSGPLEVSELLSARSDNGRYFAQLKFSKEKNTSIDDKPRQILQIWDGKKLLKSINVYDLKQHGDIITNLTFCTFAWSPFGDQTKLLYICEAKDKKKVSIFESDSEKHDLNEDKYVKQQDWGHWLEGPSHYIIGFLDVSKECEVNCIDYSGYSLARPQWLNCDRIVSTAYEETTRRLGLHHCNNRRSEIAVFDTQKVSMVDPLVNRMSNQYLSYHDPRVMQSGEGFVFLSNPISGPHFHGVKFNLYSLVEDKRVEITGPEDLYVGPFSRHYFSKDDKYLFFTSHDHLNEKLMMICLTTYDVSVINTPYVGVTLLDVYDDILLISSSAPDRYPKLFAKYYCGPYDVDWFPLDSDIETVQSVRGYEDFKIPTPEESFVSASLVIPNIQNCEINSSRSLSPTIVFVHGGPHFAHSNKYLQFIDFFCSMGFKILFINYRGSTGVDSNYLHSLSGRAGHQDVDDCLRAIRYLIKEGKIERDQLIIYGGSHGGFLACHLSCQNEISFTSAIILNPVTDLTSLYATSDIPDWVFSVGLGHYKYKAEWLPSKQDVARLYEASPMFKSSKASVPTLMLLGTNDRRVNPYQGERWADLLTSRGVDTLCKKYPDGHSLDSPKVLADRHVSAATWMIQHLPQQHDN